MMSTMSTLKDAFNTETDALGALPGSTAAAAAEANVKGAQLLRGRTKARLETVTKELSTARAVVADLTTQMGEAVEESQPTSVLLRELGKAEAKVKELDAACAVALSKDRDAAAALTQATLTVTIEKEVAALEHLKAVALRVDQLFLETQRLVEGDLVPAIASARAVTPTGSHQAFLVNLTQGFELHFLKAASSLILRGRAHATLLGAKRFSDEVPDPSIVRNRKESR